MYRETSRDLVATAALASDSVVVDLCCGTGITTEVVLSELSPAGRVVGIDGSSAMLGEAKSHVVDSRIEFFLAPAEELRSVVDGQVDAVVCNSAIWQTDLQRVAAAVAASLRPGGTFTFNVGRRFLIMPFTPEELAPRQPGLSDLATAIAILEHDFVPSFGAPRVPRRPPLTLDGIDATLREAGLTPAGPQMVEYTVTPAQQRAWLSIPVFSEQTPGRTYEEKMQILDAAFARTNQRRTESARWLIFKATKP